MSITQQVQLIWNLVQKEEPCGTFSASFSLGKSLYQLVDVSAKYRGVYLYKLAYPLMYSLTSC